MQTFSTTPQWDKQVHIIPATYPRTCSTIQSADVQLKIVVDEYRLPGTSPASLTLIMTHGTSFNKSFWEMIIGDLLRRPCLSSRIKRILTIDAVNHGDSAVINASKLGGKSMYCMLQILSSFSYVSDILVKLSGLITHLISLKL
jgi:hypothetical protein